MNWRGRPLTSHEVAVQTIAATRTSRGLHVEAVLDPGDYPIGVAVSKERFAALPLERHATHGAWNYTPHPAAATPAVSEGTTGQLSSPAHRRQEMLAKLNDERLTGMTSAGLARLCATLGPLQAARAQQRYSQQRGGRARRATGNVRARPLFGDAARLLLTLLYQRQVCPMNVLADLLEVTATCRRRPGPVHQPRCPARLRRQRSAPRPDHGHRAAVPPGADRAHPARTARPHQALGGAAIRPNRTPQLPATWRPAPALHNRFRDQQAATAEHAELLSTSLDDTHAALQLVNAQLTSLLAQAS